MPIVMGYLYFKYIIDDLNVLKYAQVLYHHSL